MNKQKKIIIILFVLAIVFTILGATFAYWNWQASASDKTEVTFTVENGFSCGADGGETITSQQKILMPTTSCTNETYAYQQEIKTSVTNSRSGSIYMDLWLDIKNIGQGLSDSPYFRYALTSQANDCEHNILAEGTFTGSANGDKIYLLDGTQYQTSGSNTYYLYIWIDSEETNPDILNQPFSVSLGGQCMDKKPKFENKPVLDTGMIPVKISDTGVVTTVSENDDTWYDYDNKQWANAVLVKETGIKTRAANKVAGTTINPNDILAYFVWIPRYSYKVWQYSGVADTVQEREIDIKFVKSNVKETATGNDQYYTHPAFTFGDKELDGIWVGKFETSTDTTDTCYATPNATNCTYDNVSPRIVPTVDSLRYQTISNEFQTALKFAGGSMTNNVVTFAGSTFYGLTDSTDSHMMKNSEWGVVAYLSHSKYGINTEIRKNNYRKSSSNYYRTSTGCGANSAKANTTTTVTTCAIPYGTPSNETYTYPQSTTGNISGVFDMSGGANEYVMGNYGNTTSSSGFEATWFTTTGNSKYYNLYASSDFTGTSTTNFTFCTLTTCGGHALNETKSWYSDNAYFVYSSAPWFGRGGVASGSTAAGAFYSNYNYGNAYYDDSFRSVLVEAAKNAAVSK